MNKVCFCAAAAGACLVSLSAAGAEFIWNGKAGDGRWKNPGNWQMRSGTTSQLGYPSTGDSIWVAIDYPMTLNVSDAESVAVLNSVDIVHLPETRSDFRITVPEGSDVTVTKPIAGGSDAKGVTTRGRLYFSGSGTIRLASTNLSDYATSVFFVDGTDVWTSQAPDLALNSFGMGVVTVTNGATLHLPTCHNGQLNKGGNFVTIAQLWGDGTVDAAETTELRFSGSGGVFSGVLGEKIGLFSGGRQYLTGTNSPMKGKSAPIVYNAYQKWSTGAGVLGVEKFGMSGDAVSSIGKCSYFTAQVYGGTYLYLGKGEVTDKYYSPYLCGDGICSIDGGDFGGLQFVTNGGVKVAGTMKWNCVFGLNGSNETACVLRGQYGEANDNYLLTTVKKGSGTWRFADPSKDGLTVGSYRKFRGTISVDEGVLQFDTIAPRGEYCSVGRATMLKPPTLGEWANLPDVDWAFSLGGTNSTLKALAEGTLEYTGTNAALCIDRRVRLEADGRFRANGPRKIRYRMAESTSARAKTLSLDGSSTATNEVSDIVGSASAPVSVVKEGLGTWAIGGVHPLCGDLTVRGGKLIVRNAVVGTPYSWFRYTIKDLFPRVDGKTTLPNNEVSVRFLGLFDADGWCQTWQSREAEGNYGDIPIEPGECAYVRKVGHSKGGYSSVPHDDNVTNIFCAATVYDACVDAKGSGTGNELRPKITDPSTWVSYVVRLTNGAPAIASFDVANTYGWNSGNKGGFHWTPCEWLLEGSVDGLHWENVKPEGGDYVINTNDWPALAKDGMFINTNLPYDKAYDKTALSPKSPYRHSGGWEIRGTTTNSFEILKNIGVVQVDSGATLEIVNAQSEISKLCVDAQLGAGTIKGATFAANGSVRIKGYSKDKLSIPFDLSGSTDVENLADWSVSVDGKKSAGYRVGYADGKLKIYPPGILLIVR